MAHPNPTSRHETEPNELIPSISSCITTHVPTEQLVHHRCDLQAFDRKYLRTPEQNHYVLGSAAQVLGKNVHEARLQNEKGNIDRGGIWTQNGGGEGGYHGVIVLHPDLEISSVESLHRQLHVGAAVASSGGSEFLTSLTTHCSR